MIWIGLRSVLFKFISQLGKRIEMPASDSRPDLIPSHQWQVCEVGNHSGLLLIKNPFTSHGQRYWIKRLVKDFPCHPNRNNLPKDTFPEPTIKDWFGAFSSSDKDVSYRRKLQQALRWTTLGYHYNWDAKTYCEEEKSEMPIDLNELASYFAKCLGFDGYRAQAVIVNYYPIATTLAGHVDNSEADLDAPLISVSFGQKAIFLIGGREKEEKPDAIFLNSGDVLVMGGDSRLSYHAVPRVIGGSEPSWNLDVNKSEAQFENHLVNQTWDSCTDSSWKIFDDYISETRLNINIRQVLKEGQDALV
jgi:alkylated DNA repair protein alkB homolog 1